jgi:ATP phosphoribosyltransferase regulatory subunit
VSERGEDDALLPAGLRDVLPPDAAHEAGVVAGLLTTFERRGYQRVKPPLVEFEESLLRESGAAMAAHTIRVMDPVSQRMMGLRADMTLQVARIATTRLAKAPRPLRLSYAGDVLRVRGTQLVPERQLGQVGAELIGSDAPAADAEVLIMAVEALTAAGVSGLTVDLTIPTLVPALCEGLAVAAPASRHLRDALDHKDASAVALAAGGHASLFAALVDAAGPAADALERLGRLDLVSPAARELERLAAVAARVSEAAPELDLTIDPVENRGFEYHCGVCFAIFARAVRGELGRGGRYLAGPAADEAATGVTLETETVMRAVPDAARARRLYAPHGTLVSGAKALRAEGWTVIEGLTPAADPTVEAERLGCDHILRDGAPIPLA